MRRGLTVFGELGAKGFCVLDEAIKLFDICESEANTQELQYVFTTCKQLSRKCAGDK
jgi:hypothetical protein